MKRVMKIEFERAYRSIGMKAALGIGLFIAVIQFIQYSYPWRNHILTWFSGSDNEYPLSLFNMWIGVDDTHPWLAVYMTIFPILAAMPYGVSYYLDIKSGYVRNVCVRSGKKKYLAAKYFAVFVSAGTTVLIPMIFNLLLTAAFFPALIPSMNGLFAPGGVGMFAGIFYTNPWLYVLIYLMMYFIYGGVLASISIAVTDFIRNSFLILLFPFIIYYGTGLLSPFIRVDFIKEISMRRLLTMTQYRSISEYTFFGLPLLIGFISLTVYCVRGIKNDIF